MIKKMYRIFDDGELPRTLFHGVNGSRTLPLDEWIDSVTKEVNDGGNISYTSGFHVVDSLEKAIAFLSRYFRKLEHRVICAVDVDMNAGTWKKEHSRSDVILAKRMRIKKDYWDKRVKYNG